MADKTHFDSSKTNDTRLLNYPIPLSPPLPAISKEIERNRAMSASSKSSMFSLSSKDVIFEDEWMVVVNKPQGIYCETVLSAIPQLLNSSTDSTEPKIQTSPPELHLANRLDRDTSGLMVITKSHKVAGKLVKAFTDRKVKNTYIDMCIGYAPRWDRISLKSGYGRSKFGVWRIYAASDLGRSLPGGSSVKDMATTFEVLSVKAQKVTKAPQCTDQQGTSQRFNSSSLYSTQLEFAMGGEGMTTRNAVRGVGTINPNVLTDSVELPVDEVHVRPQQENPGQGSGQDTVGEFNFEQ